MKVTVSFGNVKIVVPCGQGNISIKELSEMAVLRYQKSLHQARSLENSATGLRRTRDDKPDSGDSIDPGVLSTANELGVCQVDSLTLARDGGLLDWDDKVIDVLDDREMLVAHYHLKDSSSSTSLSDHSSTRSFTPNTKTPMRYIGKQDSAEAFQQQPPTQLGTAFSSEFRSPSLTHQVTDESTTSETQRLHPVPPPVPVTQPSTVFPGSQPAPPPPMRSFKQTLSPQMSQAVRPELGQTTVTTFR
ncbi:hypothetical protein T265_14489, partial [Opisthorchis viverrini]